MQRKPATRIQSISPAKPLSYPIYLRIGDTVAGRRDGAIDLAAPHAEDVLDRAPTSWLRNNQHQYQERASLEQVAAHTEARPLIERHNAMVRQAHVLSASRELALRALSDFGTTLPPQQTQQATGTESHLSPDQVAVRRRREHENARAPLVGRLQDAERREREHEAGLSELHAQIEVAFETLVRRVERLREFHNRRAAAYERSYLRHVGRNRDNESLTMHPLAHYSGIQREKWTTTACPWLAQSPAHSTSIPSVLPH